MRKEILLPLATTAALLGGCTAAPEVSTPAHTEAAASPAADPNALPPAVQAAAQAIVSIETPKEVQKTVDASGQEISIFRSTAAYTGSGTLVAEGYALTANHITDETNRRYGCLGQKVLGLENNSSFSGEVATAATNFQKYGDIALAHFDPTPAQKPVALAESNGEEQKVYLVNYQSTSDSERQHTDALVRSPDATDPAMAKPAIFSGVAKRSPEGSWVIVTGDGITQNYGSGNPQILREGGSGGALLNEAGELLAVTNAVSDAIHPDPQTIKTVTNTQFDTLKSTQKYWLQYGVNVDSSTVAWLKTHQKACQPDHNDKLIVER